MRNPDNDIFDQLFGFEPKDKVSSEPSADRRFAVFGDSSHDSTVNEISYSSVVSLNKGRLTHRQTISLSSDSN